MSRVKRKKRDDSDFVVLGKREYLQAEKNSKHILGVQPPPPYPTRGRRTRTNRPRATSYRAASYNKEEKGLGVQKHFAARWMRKRRSAEVFRTVRRRGQREERGGLHRERKKSEHHLRCRNGIVRVSIIEGEKGRRPQTPREKRSWIRGGKRTASSENIRLSEDQQSFPRGSPRRVLSSVKATAVRRMSSRWARESESNRRLVVKRPTSIRGGRCAQKRISVSERIE